MLENTGHSTSNSCAEGKLATVDLTDCLLDGRVIIGRCTTAARQAGVSKAEITSFFSEAVSSSQGDLLALVARKFDVLLNEE